MLLLSVMMGEKRGGGRETQVSAGRQQQQQIWAIYCRERLIERQHIVSTYISDRLPLPRKYKPSVYIYIYKSVLCVCSSRIYPISRKAARWYIHPRPPVGDNALPLFAISIASCAGFLFASSCNNKLSSIAMHSAGGETRGGGETFDQL